MLENCINLLNVIYFNTLYFQCFQNVLSKDFTDNLKNYIVKRNSFFAVTTHHTNGLTPTKRDFAKFGKLLQATMSPPTPIVIFSQMKKIKVSFFVLMYYILNQSTESTENRALVGFFF